MQKFVMAASDVSLDYPQSNEIYFSVTMRMLTTEVNLNGVRLTAGFIDDIAEHAEEYICMPLCADIDRLSRGLDIGLTHMYDERRQMFEAPQVGSFFEVHRVEDEHGVSLVGTARINKRNADVTDKIIQMYNTGRLKFSFEIWASELYDEDGVTVVDAAPGNRLTAMAIVTTPALPAAVALNLAAEVDIDAFEHKIKKLLERKFGDDHWEIVWMGLEYTVVYFSDHGNMLHIGYRVDGDELVETETYEVGFARIDEVNKEMDNTNIEIAETTNVETPAVEETTATAEAVLNTDTVVTEEAAVEDEMPCAETEAAACGDETKAEVENDIDDDIKDESDSDAHDLEEMRLELERVNAELAQYKAAEAEAKLAEKRAAARKYAEREHLNLEAENVKAAIENADYEALAAAVMEKPVENKEEESYRVVAEMNVSPYGNMFEKAN